ncbi:MAG: ribosomal protein S18-alanine N-acetyltransferase [Calditrichia bacterium]
MKIRRMKESDLDTVVILESRIFPDPWSYNSFRHEVHNNPFAIPLVLEESGEIIGYAIIWKIFEEFHIANFAIRPEFQGKKRGTYFFEEILKYADESSYALLEVRESNLRAISLYEKYGFKTILKRERYYANGETALVMQKMFVKKPVPGKAD